MENPYESPRSETQPVAPIGRLLRQRRLACWLMVFVGFPPVCSALLVIYPIGRYGPYFGIASMLFSALGLCALLRNADCSLLLKVIIFALAIVCILVATLCALASAFVMAQHFGIDLLPLDEGIAEGPVR